MNSMENQSKTTSKPGPLCSKRAVVNLENEGDLEIQEESFTPSNGSSYNRKLGIFTNKSTSSEGSGKLSFLFLVKVGVIVICILFFSITMTKV